jgi:hypothetical protein
MPRALMGEVSTIGLDIAKSIFQVHGVDRVLQHNRGQSGRDWLSLEMTLMTQADILVR